MATTHIALLRGINVGGKNKLPMRDLVTMFEKARCREVRTYIQSGNVLFKAGAAVLAKVPSSVQTAIRKQFGYEIPVVIRSANEVEQVICKSPFAKKRVDAARLHVVFLADTPTAALVKTLDPHRSDPDEFVVAGKDIYLHLPNGNGQTKLTNAYFDSKLKTVSTVRNWRTVNKLLELAR